MACSSFRPDSGWGYPKHAERSTFPDPAACKGGLFADILQRSIGWVGVVNTVQIHTVGVPLHHQISPQLQRVAQMGNKGPGDVAQTQVTIQVLHQPAEFPSQRVANDFAYDNQCCCD